MDLSMPIIDGYQATKMLREIEKCKGLPPIPIIALSAHSTEIYKSKALKYGMNKFSNYI